MKSMNIFVGLAVLCGITQSVRAADAPSRDALQKMFVEREAEWAALACTHKALLKDLLWDDFVGTAPDGSVYTKQQALESMEGANADATHTRDCRLLRTQVHFYSDDIAVVFGTETAVESKSGGAEERRCLYWTDTWLRRAGRWHIAAVQDAQLPCPKGE
jgi:hypothetical protein